jgi:hypothetical protein
MVNTYRPCNCIGGSWGLKFENNQIVGSIVASEGVTVAKRHSHS